LHISYNQPLRKNLAQGTEVLTVRGVGFVPEVGQLDGDEDKTTVVVLDGVKGMATYKILNTLTYDRHEKRVA
jgi:hypothetical protein